MFPFHDILWLLLHEGWQMVSRKFRVSEIFVPISKSRRRFEWVSKSCFLAFLCISDSGIFGREVLESRIFVFLANGFDQNHDRIVYLIKNVRKQSFEYVGAISRVFESNISRHGVTFWNSWLNDLTFIEYRVAHYHVSLLTVLGTGSDFCKIKSRARFSWYRVSVSDFVKAFKSRSWIFKQGSWRVSDFTICHPLHDLLIKKWILKKIETDWVGLHSIFVNWIDNRTHSNMAMDVWFCSIRYAGIIER